MRFFLSSLMMVVMMVVYTTADPAMFLVETEDNHGPADVGMYNGLAYKLWYTYVVHLI